MLGTLCLLLQVLQHETEFCPAVFLDILWDTKRLNDVDGDQNDAVEGAADNMRTIVNAVVLNMLLRIDANPQHKVRGDDTRERGRRSHHERGDHLKPRRLFNVCAAKDRVFK